jgi:oligopeptide/dipeptide ABC transporter ATP-binding protein
VGVRGEPCPPHLYHPPLGGRRSGWEGLHPVPPLLHVKDLLTAVRIPSPAARMKEFPHQMSGGMRQRIVGAISQAGGPQIIIADEPTTNLDVTIQLQYLNLLKDLQRASGVALIFVTHNLGIVAKMCDKVAVMYAGKIVELQSVRGLFYDPRHPYSSLSPRMRVGSIIGEPIVTHERLSRQEVRGRVAELLELVGLRPDMARLFPHEFSGGQRQRLAIARALSTHARLIVLDEPVSALDVSIRAHIIGLLEEIQARMGVSYLFIAHDLAAVAYINHWIAVMYLGKIVEVADSLELCEKPLHPYTKALFAASLPSHPDEEREEIVLSGELPSALNPPSGCHFHPRCPFAIPRCSGQEPELVEVSAGHQVACYLY